MTIENKHCNNWLHRNDDSVPTAKTCVGCNTGPCVLGILNTENNVDTPIERINHPAHYGGKDNPFEAIKIIEAYNLNFSLGNALKYLLRAGVKDPNTLPEDLRKAAWYLEREAKRIEDGGLVS